MFCFNIFSIMLIYMCNLQLLLEDVWSNSCASIQVYMVKFMCSVSERNLAYRCCGWPLDSWSEYRVGSDFSTTNFFRADSSLRFFDWSSLQIGDLITYSYLREQAIWDRTNLKTFSMCFKIGFFLPYFFHPSCLFRIPIFQLFCQTTIQKNKPA